MKKTTILLMTLLLSMSLLAQMQLIYNTNLSEGTSIFLPLKGTVNVTVDWGNDSTNVYTTAGLIKHTYATEGTYVVEITGSLSHFGDSIGVNPKLIKVSDFGDLGLSDLSYAFSGAYNLTEVPLSIPSTVTNMAKMFRDATSFNQYIGSWDVSQVTNMSELFKSATSFNQDIGAWNVGNVIDMSEMFRDASSFNQDIGTWNVSQVTDMSQLFKNAFVFNQNILTWNVGNVINMPEMFRDASSFNQGIGTWDVGNVINMNLMFKDAILFDQNLGPWNVSQVNSMSGMFENVLLSTSHYNALLNNWANQIVENGLSFHGGNSQYSCNAEAARTLLINEASWSIIDGGMVGIFSTDVIIACESFDWIDGNTYAESNNIATHTLINASGCDSVVSLDLTINNNGSTDVITECDSLKWIDGNTYTESNNTATHTLINALGCDSVVTLDLTMNYRSATTDIQTACNSYDWIDGNTYYVSNNTATHTLINATGCDSVVTLDLIMGYTDATIDHRIACDSFEWIDGNTYTESNNTATHTMANIAGCDSVVTLNLIINYSDSTTDVRTACNFLEWIDGIIYTENNNISTYTLINTSGCDSVVTLNLTINNSNTSTDMQTACNSFEWIDGNTYTENNNTAAYTLTNSGGCDSVVTLDLTILSNTDVTIEGSDIIAEAIGATYQWINCTDNFTAIVGETSQIYTPSSNSYFAVEVTEGGCVDTSDCISLNPVVIEYNKISEGVKIYPNPTKGQFQIEGIGINEIEILSVTGQLLRTINPYNKNTTVDLSQEAKGVYFVKLISSKGIETAKLVLE